MSFLSVPYWNNRLRPTDIRIPGFTLFFSYSLFFFLFLFLFNLLFQVGGSGRANAADIADSDSTVDRIGVGFPILEIRKKEKKNSPSLSDPDRIAIALSMVSGRIPTHAHRLFPSLPVSWWS